MVILLAISSIIIVSAAAKNTPVGNLGHGYVNVQSKQSISAWTTANSSGTTSSDFVEVNYWGYTGGSTVWRPNNGNMGDGAFRRTGTNWIEAFSSDNNLANITYVDSSHTIKRGNTTTTSWNWNCLPG
jgi:hypothetical protein